MNPFGCPASKKDPADSLRTWLLLPFFLGILLFCSGCGKEEETQPLTKQAFLLNTIVTVKLYDSQDSSLLDEVMELCEDYERIFSRTDPQSELYRLNHGELEDANGVSQVSQDLAALLEKGLDYSRLSRGALDITIGPVSSLWDFTSEEPSLPRKTDILGALPHVDYENLLLEQCQVQFQDPDMSVDLGCIAKGYIADRMKEYLVAHGVESATITLGGNVLCIGAHPDGTPFRIGIQKPFADRNETMAVADIKDLSVVTSGTYERYFQKDGVLYHHILNPDTGYPYDNDLTSVTIISQDSADGDGLSTACFALGLQDGMKLVEAAVPKAYGIFVTKDGDVHYTRDLQKDISLSQ